MIERIMPELLPPHDTGAEQALIGALLISPAANDACDNIQPRDFYDPRHAVIFTAIQNLKNQNRAIDRVTVCDALQDAKTLDRAGGAGYVIALSVDTPTAANARYYADIVLDKSRLRRLIAAGETISRIGYEAKGHDSIAAVDAAQAALSDLDNDKTDDIDTAQILKNVVNEIDKRHKNWLAGGTGMLGITSGYLDLDKITLGFQQGKLIIVAGRPSMGKSTVALNIAEKAAFFQNKSVLYASLEMDSNQLVGRSICSLGNVLLNNYNTGNIQESEWSGITKGLGFWNSKKLTIDDRQGLTISQLRGRARAHKRKHGLDMLIVDYLQLMTAQKSGQNRNDDISEISRGLKLLARELNIPVIALSQLSRKCEERADKRPMMSDLRESGAIEQDADLIVFIYRDEIYNDNSQRKGIAELIIRKNRDGECGTVYLTSHLQYANFKNCTFIPPAETVGRQKRGFSD